MTGAIFLSASVPDPKRSPQHAKTADTVAITSAVGALVYVTLGRRRLVWGGHPAITPMIWVVAESMGVDYGKWVKLYQSKFFKEDFPEDNEQFRNVVLTERQQEVIESLVQSGRYQNASEVLRDGLRLVEQREAENAAKLAALRAAAEVGWRDLESGRYRVVTPEGLADYIGELGVRARKGAGARD